MIAALFVDPNGIYANRSNVDVWGPDRDARDYPGDLPVVAHPPCHLWTNFAHLNFARYGGEQNRPANDGGCFSAALDAVRRYGGVLEHPAESKAWRQFGLLAPLKFGWQCYRDEWTCEVWQSAYGHVARKRTWLLYHGECPPFQLNWSREPGTHHIGWMWRGRKPSISKRAASATPPAFADVLIELACNSQNVSAIKTR